MQVEIALGNSTGAAYFDNIILEIQDDYGNAMTRDDIKAVIYI